MSLAHVLVVLVLIHSRFLVGEDGDCEKFLWSRHGVGCLNNVKTKFRLKGDFGTSFAILKGVSLSLTTFGGIQ